MDASGLFGTVWHKPQLKSSHLQMHPLVTQQAELSVTDESNSLLNMLSMLNFLEAPHRCVD
jgi:hypothetical protein